MEKTGGAAGGGKTEADATPRGQGFRAMSMARFTLLLVAATLAIEALLAFRAWVQLSGWQLDIGALRALYDLSTVLVSPFRGIETRPVRANDVLELATVVAVEAYLVLAVLAFGVGLAMRAAARVISLRFERDGIVLTTTTTERQAA